MFKTIATKIANARARFAAWRAARRLRKAPRHAFITDTEAVTTPVDELKARRLAKKIEGGLRKTAIMVTAAGLVALLVFNPMAFWGLLFLATNAAILAYLVAFAYQALDAVV